MFKELPGIAVIIIFAVRSASAPFRDDYRDETLDSTRWTNVSAEHTLYIDGVIALALITFASTQHSQQAQSQTSSPCGSALPMSLHGSKRQTLQTLQDV